MCVYSLRYPAWNAHSPYCHLWPVQLYNIFPTVSHKRRDFQKTVVKHKMRDFFLRRFCETFLTLRIEREIVKNMCRSPCKVPVTIVRFQWILNCRDRCSKNAQIPNFIKIRPVGADSFHADRRTDMTKLIVAFRNFSKKKTLKKGAQVFRPEQHNI